jgi:formylglycine-generating enzyme required for sulfatase activity
MTRSSLLLIVSILFALANAMLISRQYTLTRDISESPEAREEMSPYLETIPGSKIRFEMVPIPGGSFVMGSPAGEPGRAIDEGPQHEVAIRPFWMQAVEVTWDEYDLFAFVEDLRKDRAIITPENRGAADALTYPTPPYADESFGYGKGKQPAISMSHHAAMEYCRWLSIRTGKTYRLPTEAEWEYACRAGTKTAYSFGDDARELGEYGWYAPNSDSAPRGGGKNKTKCMGLV